jgi:hypothetical protein
MSGIGLMIERERNVLGRRYFQGERDGTKNRTLELVLLVNYDQSAENNNSADLRKINGSGGSGCGEESSVLSAGYQALARPRAHSIFQSQRRCHPIIGQ